MTIAELAAVLDSGEVTSRELDPAFFFSTDEAVEAHQALLPSPDQLADLRAGFLGQVRDGVFTPGEDFYPD